jgi:geranylgeranyl pyrophosphate synthase
MLPLLPSVENVRDLLGKSLDIQTEGLNLSAYGKSIIHPVREIIDRKGKAWRSFTTLLCIDAVGGDSNRFHHWLAFPEVLHTGSLMIDDIQDKSETRRGGPSAHMIYGEAETINAGCCAYFTSLQWAINKSPELTSRERIFVYEKYFECLTAAHGGQALDIHGLDYLMPEAVKTGDPDSILEKSVREIHRLKSGVPAGSLAQVGAFLGGGSSKQVECLGKYFETVGVAFQIIDDVLNLTGLPGKTRGEDITAGKVTYPVAKAMRLLSNETDRQDIWNTISSKPSDQEIVVQIIGKLESCGAVEACVQDANKIVEDAWRELNPVIPDSLHKIFIRAFGSFVLERHY